MAADDQHQSHGDIIKRLKRANGHLSKVVTMIEDGKACVDVAQQLHAVYRAIATAKQAFVRDHIEHCLDERALKERSLTSIKRDLAEITKYL